MLSDEEKKAVEYFKDNINYLEDALNHPNFLGHFITIRDKEIQMLKILVNLIKKQSKEIEELKENKGYHLGFIDGGIAKKYEYQDKIKAKIEEIKKNKENIYFEEHLESILQSLLEKE